MLIANRDPLPHPMRRIKRSFATSKDHSMAGFLVVRVGNGGPVESLQLQRKLWTQLGP
jgi:hypothetical protein